MSESKISWEPFGSMLFGYVGSVGPEYLVQGPERGMYRLYEFKLGVPIGIEDFDDIEKAISKAEEMEANRC